MNPLLAIPIAWALSCPDTVMLWSYAARAQTVCEAGWFSGQLITEAHRCGYLLPSAEYSAAQEEGIRGFNANIAAAGQWQACMQVFLELPNYMRR